MDTALLSLSFRLARVRLLLGHCCVQTFCRADRDFLAYSALTDGTAQGAIVPSPITLLLQGQSLISQRLWSLCWSCSCLRPLLTTVTLYTVHQPGALEGSSKVKKMYTVTNLVHDVFLWRLKDAGKDAGRQPSPLPTWNCKPWELICSLIVMHLIFKLELIGANRILYPEFIILLILF